MVYQTDTEYVQIPFSKVEAILVAYLGESDSVKKAIQAVEKVMKDIMRRQ